MAWPKVDLYGIDHLLGGVTHTDLKIAAFAQHQHQAVARWQLLRVGVTAREIEHRVATGLLFPKYRGVYAIGSPYLTQHGEWMAAALSCGDPALLGCRSRAGLRGFLQNRWPIQVIVPYSRAPRRGIRTLQVPSLRRSDIDTWARIPTTSIPRLFVDLAATEDEGTVRRAFREADRQNRLVYRELRAALGTGQGRKGSGLLRELIADARAPEPTRGDFEEIWIDFCDEYEIPAPVMNSIVEGREVDSHWPGTPVIVELDSWTWHSDREAFEDDRAKWEQLQVAGYAVLPITYRRLSDDPDGVAASVLAVLARPSRMAGTVSAAAGSRLGPPGPAS